MNVLIDHADAGGDLREIYLASDDCFDLTTAEGIYRARQAANLAERESNKLSKRTRDKQGNAATVNGGGIAAISSTATTLTQTAVTVNAAGLTAGGVYRLGGTMTTTNSPITANTPNNCVGSTPAVPNCTG